MTVSPLSLYVHLPWCESKCPYCDFNSYAAGIFPERDYMRAMLQDIKYDARMAGDRCLQSVFIGGGTPSLFSTAAIAELLDAVRHHFALEPHAEITLEANPGSLEQNKFAGLKTAGVNRLSLGVQSFNDSLLRRLGRVHTAKEALQAFDAAHEAGFNNVNFDLMYGLPGQTLKDAEDDLQHALLSAPKHISYYQLTIEPNTFFHKHQPCLPGEDEIGEMELSAYAALGGHGYHRYEISAYARRGYACRHNLNYWFYGDYLGIGAGAHTKLSLSDGRVLRFVKHRHPDAYMAAAAKRCFYSSRRVVADEEIIFEFVLNAARLTEGFTRSLFTRRTGLPFERVAAKFAELERQGLLVLADDAIRPTPDGLRFLNEIQMAFLPVRTAVAEAVVKQALEHQSGLAYDESSFHAEVK